MFWYKAQTKVVSHQFGTLVTLFAYCSNEECDNTDSATLDGEILYQLKDNHVDKVFPDWSPERREMFFLSGLCGECWDKMFPEEDEVD